MHQEQPEGPDVLYERRGPVAILTLNREKKLNALRKKTIKELSDLLKTIGEDRDVRAVVLTGRGRAFCAGADIFEYSEMKDREEFMKFQMRGEKLHEAIENLGKPVVAAVNGLALGGGFELALTCDMIVASEVSQFGFPEIKIGLIPGGGGTQRLPRLVGPKTAMKIFMTGDSISPQEALRLNVVVEVVPASQLMDRSVELAARMATMSLQALAALKRLVSMGTAGSFKEVLPYERMMVTYLYDTDESKTRVKEFVEKRRTR